MGLRSLIRLLGENLFPACCEVCGCSLVDGEDMICLQCRHAMPVTRLHLQPDNTILQRLAQPGVPIERAASYFYYFSDNPYGALIRQAKYNDRPSIARKLAVDFALSIQSDRFFDNIDLLIPIPLSRFKKLRRGYNQSEVICRGLSEVTRIPIGDNLKTRRHSTQTRRNAYQRHINVAGKIYVTHPEELAGKHILIVDDIITTGATMLAAASALIASVPEVRLSVLTLGCTKLR